MIILDTNVLSELMREAAEPRVVKWLSAQASASLFTTALSEAEIFFALACLPAGKRRAALDDAAAGLFADLEGRVLAFDSAAARTYARIAAARRKAGRPITQTDAQIASITGSRGARLATRNTDDFERCGIEIVNPWRA